MGAKVDHDVPLCVDLDGTLIRTDLLAETFLALARHHPLHLLLVPFWLMRGRAYLKRQLAMKAAIDVGLLPVDSSVLSYLEQERQRQRTICLVTASDQCLANAVAARVSLFDEVIASDGRVNLKGAHKAARLVERYGPGGFSYAGNSRADYPVWAVAKSAIAVGNPKQLRRLQRLKLETAFPATKNRFRALIQALRIHQWVKNLLLFVPLIGAHDWGDGEAWRAACEGFVAWCLAASSVYLLNDLIDLEADRAHPRKKTRPFASGDASIWAGLGLACALAVAAALVAACHPAFAPWLAVYAATGVIYSIGIKKLAVLDVLTLAFLYVVRIVAGGVLVNVPVTPWLIAFAAFFFLNLAMLKRFFELRQMRVHAVAAESQRRGYRLEDEQPIALFGAISGYLSILVMALYITAPDVSERYAHPQWLWGICPLLAYWITRAWLAAFRGEMKDDPLQYAVQDAMTYPAIALLALFMILAL